MRLHCETIVAHIDTPWTRLASLTARGLLARKGCTYDELSRTLGSIGIEESPKSVELRIQRGAFRCSFFLQLVCALHADLPTALQRILDNKTTWEDACREIALAHLPEGAFSPRLSKRLEQAGIHISPTQLESRVNSGTFSFALLLQLSHVYPIPGLERFVDCSDVAKAASEADVAHP
ncbi:hypothetical protein BJN34_22665 [Cupriavidus necator]|uniref:DUF6471 domain-containing protein n=1 Tax=Cupriavidus necator TaxID=106590 RepID=A0A1U9UVK0_CUPNE|nr:hypothetical protein BJN34_22665 [Cupriavidus necator]